MRKNLPITNVETVLPADEFIYSRTDMHGNIVEVNEAFARISAYTQEEMIGQPHNLVRHPDMPEEAFADMWAALKVGRPWRGLVKNRRKDGGYYWVVANLSPVREHGQIIGYQSVRSRPGRDEIAAAEDAYKRIREGDKSIYVKHGRVARRRPKWVDGVRSLRFQMALIGIAAVLQALERGLSLMFGLELPAPLVLALSGLTLAYALCFLFFYAPRVNTHLEGLAEWLESILLTGDLRKRFDLARSDTIGAIARRADKFVSTVQATVQSISNAAHDVDCAAVEVSAAVDHIRDSAGQQSSAATHATMAIDAVSLSISEVAVHATGTREVAEETAAVSRVGAQVTGDASRTIQALADTVGRAAEQVEGLGRRSEEISRIAGVIKEITDQTNLLALNAAIEAARAGEQGRGFAVVADEVRKLAERTAKATEEISGMIGTIQGETQEAVGGMRAGATQVAEGVHLVNEAEQSLQRINEEMGRTMQMVGEISEAFVKQQSCMGELSGNIEQVASTTESNVAMVTQTGAMVNRLNTVVGRMRMAADQYLI